MYRKLTALALVTAAACLGSTVQAENLTGWFVNGGAGDAHYKLSFDGYGGKASDTAYAVTAGWRSQFIGVEAGYVGLGSVSDHAAFDDGTRASARANGKGWTAGFNGHFNPTEHWYISARAGFFIWNVHAHAYAADDTGELGSLYLSKRGVGGYGGAGTGIDFNRHWSLGVTFDYYAMTKQHVDLDTKVYSVNVEYRF